MGTVTHFNQPRQKRHARGCSRRGITGLFWLQPPSWQRARIRELAHMFPAETISTICRTSLKEILSIIEDAA